ncbi:MAG: hypothetical protein ACE5I9_01775, partial [Candidatus Methylomirabilales bacterium]
AAMNQPNGGPGLGGKRGEGPAFHIYVPQEYAPAAAARQTDDPPTGTETVRQEEAYDEGQPG